MYEMILADGNTYSAAWCCADDNEMTVQVAENEASMEALFDTFSNVENTGTITINYGVKTIEYNGYTRLTMIHDRRYCGADVLIKLRRDVNQNG